MGDLTTGYSFQNGETNVNHTKLNTAVNEATINNLAVTEAKLANLAVTTDKIANDTITAEKIQGSAKPISAWATTTLYVVGRLVIKDYQLYISLIEHTSGTFATDLAAGKWQGLSIPTTIKKEVPQTAHGFALGTADAGKHIRHNGTAWVFGKGVTGESESRGIIESVKDANNFTMVNQGLITLSGLTPGAEYFQDGTTAGAVTTTEPSAPGTVKRSLYVAISTTEAIVNISAIGVKN